MKIKRKTKFFEKVVDDARNSLVQLRDAIELTKSEDIDDILNSVIIDGTIHRFENHFTRVVDILRFSLINEGIETMSPRQILRESARLGWIKDIDFWLIVLDARSSTMNRISDITHREFQGIISKFANETDVIMNLLLELNRV